MEHTCKEGGSGLHTHVRRVVVERTHVRRVVVEHTCKEGGS